jgi:hypothetical protein
MRHLLGGLFAHAAFPLVRAGLIHVAPKIKMQFRHIFFAAHKSSKCGCLLCLLETAGFFVCTQSVAFCSMSVIQGLHSDSTAVLSSRCAFPLGPSINFLWNF